MKLLAIMRPAVGDDVREAVTARARAELEVLWRLYRDGVVREMYLTELQPLAALQVLFSDDRAPGGRPTTR